MSFARISGTGSYLPENIMTNHDIEKLVDTSDQWIRERTGIEQRHIANKDETTVDLAEKASRLAIEAAGIDASEIDLIVLATSTPDKIFPSSACILQARLDIHGCPAFDIQAVCTGFVYALTVAEKFIQTGAAKKALVVGAEVFSRILNWKDRTTCVLFGDGAGAVILEASEEPGILSTHIHADGKFENLLWVPHG
ncbi:MAG: ketoacyl-ACP synthase III, partial [Gammaproteobacteria bacterium]|nr:ketoacyl-ACP synthase III [Gammaproteobacteria bacterium]